MINTINLINEKISDYKMFNKIAFLRSKSNDYSYFYSYFNALIMLFLPIIVVTVSLLLFISSAMLFVILAKYFPTYLQKNAFFDLALLSCTLALLIYVFLLAKRLMFNALAQRKLKQIDDLYQTINKNDLIQIYQEKQNQYLEVVHQYRNDEIDYNELNVKSDEYVQFVSDLNNLNQFKALNIDFQKYNSNEFNELKNKLAQEEQIQQV